MVSSEICLFNAIVFTNFFSPSTNWMGIILFLECQQNPPTEDATEIYLGWSPVPGRRGNHLDGYFTLPVNIYSEWNETQKSSIHLFLKRSPMALAMF